MRLVTIGIVMFMLWFSIASSNADNATAEFFNTLQYDVLTCNSSDNLNCRQVYHDLRDGETGIQYKCPYKPDNYQYDYARECTLVKAKSN